MQRLIRFFIRYSQFFIFLFLEMIALFMVVTYNQKQRDIFNGSTTAVVAYLYQSQKIFTDYVDLRQKVNDLSQENAALRRSVYEQKTLLRKLQRRPEAPKLDPTFIDSTYRFIPASVLSNSQSLRNNFITLENGSDHGIRSGMGVIGPEGVVGIVSHVTPQYSRVMSMLHSQFRLSAGLEGKNYFGTLQWPGRNVKLFRLDDIPIHAEIEKGDLVETSGFSYIFPRGIQIGTVQEITIPRGGYYYELSVELSQDLSNLHSVYVVDHPYSDNLEALNTDFDL